MIANDAWVGVEPLTTWPPQPVTLDRHSTPASK